MILQILLATVALAAIALVGSLRGLDELGADSHGSPRSNLDQWHHGYAGVLVLAGVMLAWLPWKWLVDVVAGAALVALLDDAVQHVVQWWQTWRARRRGDRAYVPRYRSPLWHLYRLLLERIR